MFSRRIIFSLLVALSTTACERLNGDRVDFKGLRLGATEAEVRTNFPTVICKDVTAFNQKARQCMDLENTIAEVPAEVFFLFHDSRVAEIWVVFPSNRFDVVTNALHKKYGEPSLDVGKKIHWTRNSNTEEVQAYATYFDLNGEDERKALVKFMQVTTKESGNVIEKRSKDL